MRLSIADVEHVAELARLGLDQTEKERLRDQLSSILDHISALNDVETESIPPTAQVNALVNVLRSDDPRPSLPVDTVLANAPRQSDDMFEVHAVLTNDDTGESS